MKTLNSTQMGAFLREKRAAKGFSVQTVSDMSGVSRRSICYAETGHLASLRTINRLLDTYNSLNAMMTVDKDGEKKFIVYR